MGSKGDNCQMKRQQQYGDHRGVSDGIDRREEYMDEKTIQRMKKLQALAEGVWVVKKKLRKRCCRGNEEDGGGRKGKD